MVKSVLTRNRNLYHSPIRPVDFFAIARRTIVCERRSLCTRLSDPSKISHLAIGGTRLGSQQRL